MFYYLISMIIGGAVAFLICNLLGDGILFLLLKAVVCLIVPNVIFYIMNFKRKECKDSILFVKGIITARRKSQ